MFCSGINAYNLHILFCFNINAYWRLYAGVAYHMLSFDSCVFSIYRIPICQNTSQYLSWHLISAYMRMYYNMESSDPISAPRTQYIYLRIRSCDIINHPLCISVLLILQQAEYQCCFSATSLLLGNHASLSRFYMTSCTIPVIHASLCMVLFSVLHV